MSWDGAAGSLRLESLDVPIVVPGDATPFTSPRTEAPNMTKGVHFNVLNNIWCVARVQDDWLSAPLRTRAGAPSTT